MKKQGTCASKFYQIGFF